MDMKDFSSKAMIGFIEYLYTDNLAIGTAA
jgi:hypothetical protein